MLQLSRICCFCFLQFEVSHVVTLPPPPPQSAPQPLHPTQPCNSQQPLSAPQRGSSVLSCTSQPQSHTPRAPSLCARSSRVRTLTLITCTIMQASRGTPTHTHTCASTNANKRKASPLSAILLSYRSCLMRKYQVEARAHVSMARMNGVRAAAYQPPSSGELKSPCNTLQHHACQLEDSNDSAEEEIWAPTCSGHLTRARHPWCARNDLPTSQLRVSCAMPELLENSAAGCFAAGEETALPLL